MPLEDIIERHVDWEWLTACATNVGTRRVASDVAETITDATRRVPTGGILVARNAESFSFLYQETLDRLSTLGPIEFFDPEDEIVNGKWLNGKFLYLPGGYPEKHLETLVKAEATRRAIKEFAEQGGHIVAECGGMMYLCQSIITDEGEFPMCGVLPYKISARKADRRLSLGYRQFTLNGKEYRGHEFHYTQFVGETPPSIVQVYDAKGHPVSTPILRYKNVLASYTHLSGSSVFPLHL